MYFMFVDSIRSDKDMPNTWAPCLDYGENTFQFDAKCIFNDLADIRNEFGAWAATM